MVVDDCPGRGTFISMFIAMIIGVVLDLIFPWYWFVICTGGVVGFWTSVMVFWAIVDHIDNLKARAEGRQIKRRCPKCHRMEWFNRMGNPEADTPYFWICYGCGAWMARESKHGCHWIHTEGYDAWLDGVKG